MTTYACPECGWVKECYPNCPIALEEVCGYFTQCDAYKQNLTCEHDSAPVYKKKETNK